MHIELAGKCILNFRHGGHFDTKIFRFIEIRCLGSVQDRRQWLRIFLDHHKIL